MSATALTVVLGTISVPQRARSQAITTNGGISHSPVQSPVWTIPGDLYIATTTSGSMTVTGGAKVSNASGHIGATNNTIGTVDISGIGSTWENSGDLTVGFWGTGRLTVSNGGKVFSTNGWIGVDANNASRVTVTGAGSTWHNEDQLDIGTNGNGTLNVESGGTVVSASTLLGSMGGNATLNLLGEGTQRGVLETGYLRKISSNVTLNLDGGILRAAGNEADFLRDLGALRAGDNGLWIDSNGYSITIGPSTTFAGDEPFVFHKIGLGTLTLNNDSSAFSGTVSVSGGTLAVTNALGSDTVNVSGASGATLRINDGGKVTSSTGSLIGSMENTSGTVMVTGANSTWSSSGELRIGSLGDGTLHIENNGAVTNQAGMIGIADNSKGTVTVTGPNSTWTNSDKLTVGSSGNGRLTIENGATVSNLEGVIAGNAQSNSAVTVTGHDSNWINRALHIGAFGTATLNIDNGATVSNRAAQIALYPNSKGSVTVSNKATWSSTEGLLVGSGGNATLRIESGGTVVNPTASIGYNGGASGSVTVSGTGSAWMTDSRLAVGESGSGNLLINDGGEVSNVSAVIGHNSNAVGTVTVSGHDSKWKNSNVISIGNAGSGTLNIGADRLSAAAAAGSVEARTIVFGGGKGTLNFNHDGTTVLSSVLKSNGNGTHALNHLAGTTMLTGDGSAFSGQTTVSGGTLAVTSALGGEALVTAGTFLVDGIFDGPVEARTGGVISGTGIIENNLDLTGAGILAGTQGKTLQINGDVSMDASSVIETQLGGAPSQALFDVNGNLVLDGTLRITDAGGFGAGIYRLFDYEGTLTDNGLDIDSIPPGITADDLLLQTSIDKQINLISSAGATLGYWDGGNDLQHDNQKIDGGDGIWQADGRNWTRHAGEINGPFQPNPTFAIFHGTAGTVTVDTSAGAIGVTGMQFVTDGYRIEGDAIALEGTGGETIIRVGDNSAGSTDTTATIASPLAGNTTLVKNDRGTLVLTGTNTFNGGVRLVAGALSVSADANMGSAAGGIVFDGGTLAGTASFASSRNVTLNATGRIHVAFDETLAFSGPVSGSGDLLKLGDGTLTLSGSNNYGNSLVAAGTLIGNADSISGNVSNAATLVFDQASNGTFTGNLGGLTGTKGKIVKRGGGILTLEGTSNLDWNIAAGKLVASAGRFSGNVDIDGTALLTFDQAAATDYAGVLSGTGNFSVTGTGAVTLTGDSSAFAGTTTVDNGSLIVGTSAGGTLGSTLTVGSNALLGGSGSIGSAGSTVAIAAGGIHAPGNSIGVQHIAGNYINHGILRIEATPTEADRIIVAGSVDITDATLDLVLSPADAGSWDLFNGPFTIIEKQSAGKVTGTFDPVKWNLLFLDALVTYDGGDGNDVTLELQRNARHFAAIGHTPNQIATGAGIETLDETHAIWRAIALIDDEATARASYDALSGEIHASLPTALIGDSRFVRAAANDRIRAALGTAGAASAPVLSYAGEQAATPVSANHAGPVFWSQGFGAWGSTDSNGNAAALDHDTNGLLVGTDAPVGDWRIGMLAGYSHSGIKANQRSSRVSSDSYHVGLYGGRQLGSLSIRTGTAYTWHDIDTARTPLIPGSAARLTAGYRASTFQAFGELGHGFNMGNIRMEPFANLSHVSLHTNGFSEAGGDAALAGNRSNTNVTFTTLGLHGEHADALGAMNVILKGTLGWRRAFGTTTPTSAHAFGSGHTFTIAGAPIAKNSAIVEAGLDLNLTPNASLSLSYSGQISSDTQDHGFKANLGIRF